MSTLSTYLSTFGQLPAVYPPARGDLHSLIANLYLADQVKWVTGGTSTTAFNALWPNSIVPEIAFVVEGDTLWYTRTSGASWVAVTQANSVRTGTIEMTIETTAPTGYLILDGSAQLISSYSALNTALLSNIGATTLRRSIVQSAWTSTSNATFTHIKAMTGLANSDSINLYWNGGTSSRLGLTLSSVTTSSFTASGGTGDNIPNDTTIIYQFYPATTKFLLPDMRLVVPIGAANLGGTTINDLLYQNIIVGSGGTRTGAPSLAAQLNYFEIIFRIKT